MIEISHQLRDIATTLNSLSRSVELRTLQTARFLARSGKYTLACRQIESQVFTEPRQKVEATLLLAKVFAQQGAFDKAAACWKQALRADAGNQEAILGLATISMQNMNPVIFRAIGFIAGCFVLILMVVGLGVYLNHQAQQLSSRIASVALDNRDYAMDQAVQIKAHIDMLQDVYSRKTVESSAKIDSLNQKLDLMSEQNKQRDQSFSDKLTAALAGIQDERMKNHLVLLGRLSTLESGLAEQKSALLRKGEADATRFKDGLDRMASAFDAHKKTINDTITGTALPNAGRSEAMEARLKSIEQQFVEIRALLKEINKQSRSSEP
jgi:hypothetical protein